jgi:putative Holliday junction resolvase
VRALGLDLGSRRIGVALSTSDGTLATPYEVISRTRDRQADHRAIARLARDEGAEVLVVGLPLSLDGTDGPAAIAARAEAEELVAATGLPVELWDERLTTVSADRALAELDLDARARRRVVDKVAAAVMLQAWLDHRRLATAREDTDR